MRRTLAVLAISGLTLVGLAQPASASTSVSVTPSTNLTGGTTVTVSWSGFTPFGTPSLVQCVNSPATGAGGSDCEFLTLQVASDASNAAGAGSDTFTVRDTAGLAALNSRTNVTCDPAHSGSILVLDNPNDRNSGAFQTVTCVATTFVPQAPHVLVSCTGVNQIATVNPALGSRSAKYVKEVTKDSIGDKTEFGTNANVPTDATTCALDSGIRTDDPNTNSGTATAQMNPFDNQSNGFASLTTHGSAIAKTVMALAGSSTCQTEPQATVNNSYPRAYPIQGKVTVTFDQHLSTPALNPAHIQIQEYVRFGKDISDPNPTHVHVTGIVTKGPGLGGDVSATLRVWPTTNVKNLNPLECSDADVTQTTNSASLTEMAFTQADGSDGNTTVDPWTVTIPG